MSREQANTYRKFRHADDKQGNLGWAARMNRQGMRIAPEAGAQIPAEFEFNDKEKAMWSLLKIARRYNDLENCGLLEGEDVRAFLRGLVSADVLDIVDHDQCKSLLPLEVKRALGQKKKAKVGGLKARVYRPDIGIEAPKAEPPPSAIPARTISKAFVAPPNSNIDVGLTREEKQRKKELEDAFEKMDDQSHYAFLGVPQSADAAAIKAAYMKLARELHPDHLGSPLQKEKGLPEKTDALFKRLQTVNAVLSNTAERAKYDATLKSGQSQGSEGGKIRRPQEAKLAHAKADVFFKKKDYQTAERHYKIAMELDGEDPTYAVAHAWCCYLNESQPLEKRTTVAKDRLRKIYDTKNSGEAAYKLGLLATAAQDEKQASLWFDRCLKLNPEHQEARQQKRVREMRQRKAREGADAGKSVLGRFFKK